MTYEFIKYEASDGIGRVTLNRPEKLNALSPQLQAELIECLTDADEDPDIRVITLRGAGRAFCAGYDITPPQTDEDREITKARRGNIRSDMQRLQKTARLMTSIFDLSKPVIAGIHGHVIAGGTDLALHCDIIIAADDANIGFPPVRSMGTPPTHMWTYMVGPQWAKWFMLTGETVSGQEASDMGLVWKSVPAEGLEAAVEDLARKMAKIPWEMLAANKSIVNKALDLMGRNMMQVIAAETDAVSHQSPIVKEFNQISSEQGLKAALEWRDRPFRE
ncbi:MAG: enoyl-CoA hydratase [Chloroflexi bacterium]|nr:enoyl-CoA hydratase [Chloroflexota bacterium]MEC7836071.1 crotonase/enoyl-CoA hydratase family protein [Chloroflexota bacterium]MEC9365847.1 crotonase/enoyl-CoA hydratase family protein [Chloroflexota bacterium]MED5409440.1 crotonase/enoyl-CoA hydratase family protein [Chloroflexota bacterium]|tara:strand:+ start:2521 stop:3348 length:828 start_codon:yes stop_codon:yes gene_type:complete